MDFQRARHEGIPGVSLVTVILCLCVGGAVAVAGLYYLKQRPVTVCGPRSPVRQLTAIETAVEYFKTEYGAMPATSAKLTTDSAEGVEFLNVLLGVEPDSPEMKNPRKIKFLSYKEAKDGRDGLVYDPTYLRAKGLFDPWGSPLTVVLDVEKSGSVRVSSGSAEMKLEGRTVAVTSPGKDKKIGTADDIKSW